MTSSAAASGSTLGRYQILKHLASGGMAELYLARATGIEGFERYVVVKKILGDHAKDSRFVKMFIDEARLAAQLHHQNIAQVYDCGQEDGTYYFAMEYVHGENVRDLLKKMASLRRQVPLEHALTIVAGAAAGLHHAHERRGADRQPLNLVHRDVSPSNLLVAYDGAVKVVDFGIAKAASRMTETRSGTLKGKIAYMSPEQCLGRAVDRRSDVFALGIVLYELTTVSRLFKGENDYITMNRIVTGDITPPTKKRPDYPPGLEAITMKALALDPADRYQTAGEMLEAIEQFCARERISLSAIGLGRFIRELFGERPEPWVDLEATAHDDLGDESVEITRSNVDSGVTHLPTPATVVSRPGATSRSAATVAAGVVGAAAPGPKSQSLVLAVSGESSRVDVRPRRGWMWGAAAVAAAAAIGAGFAIGRRGSDGARGDLGSAGVVSGAGGAVAPTTATTPAGPSGPATAGAGSGSVGVGAAASPTSGAGSGSVAASPTSGAGSGTGSVAASPTGAGSGRVATGDAATTRHPVDAGKAGRGKGRPGATAAAGTTGAKATGAKTTGKVSPSTAGSGAAGSGSGSAAPQRDPTSLFPPQE